MTKAAAAVSTTRTISSSSSSSLTHTKSTSSNSSTRPTATSPYYEAASILQRIISVQDIGFENNDNNKQQQQQYTYYMNQLKKISNNNNTNNNSTNNKKKRISTKAYAICCKVIQHLHIIQSIIVQLPKIQLQQQIGYNNNMDRPISNKDSKTTTMAKKTKYNTTSTSTTTISNNNNNNTNIQLLLLYIMIYELVISDTQSLLRGGGTIKRYVQNNEVQIRDIYNNYIHTKNNNNHHHHHQSDDNNNNHNNNTLNNKSSIIILQPPITPDSSINTIITSIIPRYVRINTCTTNVQDFIQWYQQQEQQQQEQDQQQQRPMKMILYKDRTIPDLFIISNSMTSQLLSMLSNNNNNNSISISNHSIILQDKSSCIPAYCLYSLLLTRILVQQLQQQQQQNDNCIPIVGDIIDACAAPGNKTIHIAALVQKIVKEQQQSGIVVSQNETTNPINSSNKKSRNKKISVATTDATTLIRTNQPKSINIYAFDRNSERYETLVERTQLYVPHYDIPPHDNKSHNKNEGTTRVQIIPQHVDFLSIYPNNNNTTNNTKKNNNNEATTKEQPSTSDYSNVTCILLDPSCSGSGLYHRNRTTTSSSSTGSDGNIEYNNSINTDHTDHERLQKLSGFQITCLRHALQSFPNVHTVIYSTCSIYCIENEYVVAEVMGPPQQQQQPPGDNTTSAPKKNTTIRDEWEIVAPSHLQSWSRRGYMPPSSSTAMEGNIDINDPNQLVATTIRTNLSQDEINCMIRTNYLEDRTNGFFVTCFQRRLGQHPKSSTNNTQRVPDPPPFVNDIHTTIPYYNGEFDHDNDDNKSNERSNASNVKNVANDHSNKVHPVSNKRKGVIVEKADEEDEGQHKATTKTRNTSKKVKINDANDGITNGNMNTTTVTGTSATPSKTGISNDSDDNNNTNNNHNKKRMKKILWKQRQHEAKLLRCQNGASTTTSTTNDNQTKGKKVNKSK